MSDIDKVYDLLARLYSEVQEGRKETNQRFEQVTQRLDSLEAGQNKLDNRMNKIETTLEHDINAKLQALHERAGINTDKLENHTERLETIENKIDVLAISINSQDKRLEVVESSKRKKAK